MILYCKIIIYQKHFLINISDLKNIVHAKINAFEILSSLIRWPIFALFWGFQMGVFFK